MNMAIGTNGGVGGSLVLLGSTRTNTKSSPVRNGVSSTNQNETTDSMKRENKTWN